MVAPGPVRARCIGAGTPSSMLSRLSVLTVNTAGATHLKSITAAEVLQSTCDLQPLATLDRTKQCSTCGTYGGWGVGGGQGHDPQGGAARGGGTATKLPATSGATSGASIDLQYNVQRQLPTHGSLGKWCRSARHRQQHL